MLEEPLHLFPLFWGNFLLEFGQAAKNVLVPCFGKSCVEQKCVYPVDFSAFACCLSIEASSFIARIWPVAARRPVPDRC